MAKIIINADIWANAVGLILAGCSEDKVTKDMLIGSWECREVKYTEAFVHFDTPPKKVSEETKNIIFGSSGNDFYEIEEDVHQKSINFEEEYPNKIDVESKGKVELTNKIEVVKISNDSFSHSLSTNIKNSDTEKSMVDFKIKIEVIYNRRK